MEMSVPNNEGHQTKKIVLPSGKTIEVVYFESRSSSVPPVDHETAAEVVEEAAPAAAPAPAEDTRELHLCVNCESELVYPVQWEEAGPDSWHILLRCPDCEWTESGIFAQAMCDRFDDELEAGTDALTRDYKRMVTANMSEEIDRFAAALNADAILPIDF
jgi:hypothetical protein